MSYAPFKIKYIDNINKKTIENFTGKSNIINTIRSNLNEIPKKMHNLNILPQIFINNSEEIERINPNIGDITISDIEYKEKPYFRFFVKNQIGTLKVDNIRFQTSIIHCEFNNIDPSGKYTVQLNLKKDNNYNNEYKSIIYDIIPKNDRMTIEKVNTKSFLNVDMDNNKMKAYVFSDCNATQWNIINNKNIPIIFINCTGLVNINFNNQDRIDRLRTKTKICLSCPKQDCPKQICPSCPKQDCPKQICPSCPKQDCPTSQEDDDDEDYY